MPTPRANVNAPAFTPLPYGLLTALDVETRYDNGSHWQNGVVWESLCAQSGTTFDQCVSVTGTGGAGAPAPPAKTETAELDVRGATPFTVYAEVDCSVPGFWERAEELTRNVITQSEQWQVERALWTGLAGGQPVVYPHLASNAEVTDGSVLLQTSATTVVSGGVPLDVVEGLGRLQSALADCYDGIGVIHVPRVLEPALTDAGLIVRDGTNYRTTQGHKVVLGAGYLGSSPSGTTSDATAWVYATGPLFIYRSDVFIPRQREMIDRASNALTTLAERTYAIGWDCCHLAVNITLGGNVAGTAGSSG